MDVPRSKHQLTAAFTRSSNVEKVTGVGGMFFRAKDPKGLADWYEKHLGVNKTPTTADGDPWRTDAGVTVFSPFKHDSDYFDKSKQWMINFRVRDIAAMVAQLRGAGIEVKEPEAYEGLGKFARLHDPEGNAIELWQPE